MTVHVMLLILLLVVDALVLLGLSHDSRTSRNWRTRRSPWSVAPPLAPVPVHVHALVDRPGDDRRAS